MADLTQTIVDAAGRPMQSAKGDASLTEHRLRDLVEAAQFVAGSDAAAGERSDLGIRFRKILPKYD